MPRVIFHVDMDAFYASVEQRDNPEYRGKPLVVGAPADQRGVVAAASYEARKFSIRSAMPSRTAAKLCPDAIFVRPRMDVYRAESRYIMDILREASPVLEKVSVDEAYLDVSERFTSNDEDEALFASVTLAKSIKRRISEERGLTASIGIGPNKFLSKLGSDFQKPNGLTLIPQRDKAAFLRSLAVNTIPGVGPVTAESLAKQGIRTIADLQDADATKLSAAVGSFAAALRDRAFGNDDRPLDTSEDRKSISSETTFLQDTQDRPTLRAALKELSVDVADGLQKYGAAALTIQVKVRYSDFKTLTRQVRLLEPQQRAEEIYRTACFLLARDRLVRRPLRLLGVGASTLVTPSAQLRLPL
ncbi:DNA polymerase IV [Verrucomicrobiota bacterium sgz303538]